FSRDWSSDVCSSDLVLRHIDAGVVVVGEWDKIEVIPQTTDPALIRQLADAQQRIPGISNILEVQEHEFKDLDHIFQLTKEAYGRSEERRVGKEGRGG